MKSILLTNLLVILTVFQAFCQPTITTAYFPVANDVLISAIDKEPDASIALLGTGMQTWDYSALGFNNEGILDSFYAASTGANASFFPDADLVQIQGPAEYYYNVTDTKQELIGYAGLDPVGLGIFINAHYDEPLLFRSAPLEMSTSFLSNSFVSFAIDAEELPDSLLEALTVTPDSIRVTINNDMQVDGNAYGDLTIPGGTYSTLQVKVIEYRNTLVFGKIYNTWLDITTTLQNQFPNLTTIGLDTIIHFDFYSNSEKEAIARLFVDNESNEIQKVIYKANPVSIITVDTNRPQISISPNPVEDAVKFQIKNVPTGNYTIQVYDILGASVWSKSYHLNKGVNLFQDNLGELRKGTYLLSLVNENGAILTTQRLVIIHP